MKARLVELLLIGTQCAVLGGTFLSATVVAQDQNDHLSHHPAAGASVSDAPAANLNSKSTSNGTLPEASQSSPSTPISPAEPDMMQAMGEMMKAMMGGNKHKEIYPELMSISTLTAEKRTEIELLAEERIHAGMLLLQTAQTRLSHAVAAGDHDAAEQALQMNREGNAQVASGIAAHRLLWEGRLPQAVALQWFKQNMGLASTSENPNGVFGLSWLHFVVMFFLLAMAVSMVGIYFYKSTRTAALLTKLQTESISINSPPPELNAPTPAKPASINPDLTLSKPNSWTGHLLVARIFQETATVKTFRLIDPAGGTLPFNFLPGQFLTFTVSPHGQALKRSYTISSSPTHRDYCEVTVKHEPHGAVSGYLNDRVHEGELLQVTGPSGKFTFAGQDADSIVLIGGGVGITPMMSVVRYLTDRSWPGDIFFIYGCKSDQDVIFLEEIKYLQRRYINLHVTLAASHVDSATWPYPSGRITKELISAAVPDVVSRHIHLCGPKLMMEGVKLMLAELGVPPGQIEVEVFVGKEFTPTPRAIMSTSLDNLSQDTSPDTTPQALQKAATVTFTKSNKTASLLPFQTILEAAETVGVNIEYSCRTGTCGICKIQLMSGTVAMEVDDGLGPSDKENNIILACQARSTGDVSVDA